MIALAPNLGRNDVSSSFLYLSLYQYSYYYHIILAYPESIISYPNLLLQSSSHFPLFVVFVVCSYSRLYKFLGFWQPLLSASSASGDFVASLPDRYTSRIKLWIATGIAATKS